MQIRVKQVDLFFDRVTTSAALNRYELRVLRRTGAFGRQVMRRLIRKKGKRYRPQPGKPPRYRTGSNQGLRLIFFTYDARTNSTVIGPKRFFSKGTRRFRSHTREYRALAGKTIPELVNDGGRVLETKLYKSGRQFRKNINYRSFPFRQPAMEITLKRMKEFIEEEELK